MKILSNLLSFICFISFLFGFSQNNKGIITYKGIINERYVDSFITAMESKKEIPMHIKQVVAQDYRNAIPEDFELNFKNEESYYYLIPSLEESGYNVGSNSDTSPYYTNNATATIVDESPSLGTVSHKPIDWEITQETKKIGKYTCYKATAVERLFSRQGHYYNKQVVAWFTPEIPMSFGPSYYSGLPGLILQIERDKFTLTATKINLNPDDKDIKIKRLDKNAKVITEEEANNRIKEMMDARKKEYGG